MKKIITIVSVIALTSCTKSWVCTVETTTELGTMTHEYEFEGTKSEMEEFEELGTKTYSGVDQVTECK
jgi:hypothetical protein